jgi:hypothetical protein
MSKVITFSRFYPKYHPKAGQPTHFIEQIYNSIYKDDAAASFDEFIKLPELDTALNHFEQGVKNHTIRGGNRFKVGDKFSPRVWSGKPYNSKQIIIASDIEVKKVWDLEVDYLGRFSFKGKNKPPFITSFELKFIAQNDGFQNINDFIDWFTYNPNLIKEKIFTGQIICWNDKIEY